MSYIDLHGKPFDDGTIAKLEIFADYAEAWIPTFVMQPRTEVICIFDFFAGTGFDLNGVKGSPIRILDKVNKNFGNIFKNNVKVKLFFNEFDFKKFKLLQESCENYLNDNASLKNVVEIYFYNEDFEVLFPKLINQIKIFPSLVYLDQNGIKFLDSDYLLQLEKLNTTDFLYFTSSSYFKRFGKSVEFKRHLSIDKDLLDKTVQSQIHRLIIDELKKSLPVETYLKLYPYTIKKNQNIYGIIFGAKHPRAVDKFLKVAWMRNEVNGEANFDIDDEANLGQLDMFNGARISKIDTFKENVIEKVLNKEITNNFGLLAFTYEEGHIPRHAAECLKQLKKEGRIDYDCRSPLVTLS